MHYELMHYELVNCRQRVIIRSAITEELVKMLHTLDYIEWSILVSSRVAGRSWDSGSTGKLRDMT
jgi:hypothetical protein